jgi:uncharacterized protein (DUF58 family)
MNWSPSTLNLSFVTLVGWALFLGVLTGRAELMIVAVPLIVALAAGRRAMTSAAGWRLSRRVSADRLVEGERVIVTMTLRAREPLALVELLQPLPPQVWLERGRNHAFFTLAAGEEVRWTFELRCAGRQRLRLADLHLRLWEPLGLAAAETRHREPDAEVAV